MSKHGESDELRSEYRFDYGASKPNRFAARVQSDATAVDLLSILRGASAEDLRKVAGILDSESADEMRAAIEDGCERIDNNNSL